MSGTVDKYSYIFLLPHTTSFLPHIFDLTRHHNYIKGVAIKSSSSSLVNEQKKIGRLLHLYLRSRFVNIPFWVLGMDGKGLGLLDLHNPHVVQVLCPSDHCLCLGVHLGLFDNIGIRILDKLLVCVQLNKKENGGVGDKSIDTMGNGVRRNVGQTNWEGVLSVVVLESKEKNS